MNNSAPTTAKKTYLLTVGITGSCNLRCPSCAAGNMSEINRPGQYMSVDTYRALLAKATTESNISAVCLFITTEPLLHPQLNEIVRVTDSFGVPCMISTNLNLLPRDVDDFFAANPSSLRVSVSGYFQETYEKNHRGGKIDRVKENIKTMADAWNRSGKKCHFEVHYHRYIGNLDEEILMRKFATQLGLSFTTNWAGFHPMEKALGEMEPDAGFAQFTDDDRKVLETLPSIGGSSMIDSPLFVDKTILSTYSSLPCTIQSNYLFVDWRGQSQLCCAMGDTEKYSLGNYFEQTLEEIQNLKDKHEICRICKSHNGHVGLLLGYQDIAMKRVDQICLDNVLDYYAENGYDLRSGMQYGSTETSTAGDGAQPATHLRNHQSEYNGLVELLQQQLANEKEKSKQQLSRIAELEAALARRSTLAAPSVVRNLDSHE